MGIAVGPGVGFLVQVVTFGINVDVVVVVVAAVIVDATADIVFAVMKHGSFDDWSEEAVKQNTTWDLSYRFTMDGVTRRGETTQPTPLPSQ